MSEPNWDRTPWNAPLGELSTDNFTDLEERDLLDEYDDDEEDCCEHGVPFEDDCEECDEEESE